MLAHASWQSLKTVHWTVVTPRIETLRWQRAGSLPRGRRPPLTIRVRFFAFRERLRRGEKKYDTLRLKVAGGFDEIQRKKHKRKEKLNF